MQKEKGISVIIPTIGRAKYLIQTIQDLKKQTGATFEVIIVFNGDQPPSTDMSSTLLGQFSDLRIYWTPEPNASLARNIGLREARYDFVLFLDDDVRVLNERFLAIHVAHLCRGEVVAVAGPALKPVDPRPDDCMPLDVGKSKPPIYDSCPMNSLKPALVRHAGSGNLSVLRKAACEIGGMDAQFERGAMREEADFCYRLTRRFGHILFEPAAWLVHLAAPQGGARQWGINRGARELHHATGEWYFILKGLRYHYIPPKIAPRYFLDILRSHFLHAWRLGGRKHPLRMIGASGKGLLAALRKLRQGARHIETLTAKDYQCLYDE